MDSVFPVQLRLATLDEKNFLSDWLQGFTNNIGKGGLCLSINNLNPQWAGLLKAKNIKLFLNIEVPLTKGVVSALAKIAWIREISGRPGKYLVGLNYEMINPQENSKIMRYAYFKKLFAPATLGIIILLGLALLVNGFINIKLSKANKSLVEQLVKIVQESSIAKQKVKQISGERGSLQAKIQALHLRIQTLGEERIGKESKRIEEFNNLIKQLTEEKLSLQEQLVVLQQKENVIAEELLRLDKAKLTLEKANFAKMYLWLKVHQNPRTGLIMSYEGDSDIRDWAFIYDQALVIEAYNLFSDLSKIEKMLDFFKTKAKRLDGLFLNAYYVNDGTPAEYVVHSGPNIWLGVAILQYTKKFQDYRYLDLAEDIARNIINLQDKEGGIRGGPNLGWYSTEHNLDAYAFFNMLYKITNKQEYLEISNNIINWLVENTYSNKDIPIKRGKGDSTVATDTYGWSIAAIGPEKLEALGMGPDRILDFVEKNCAVETDYIRPEGQTVKIKGFDFAPQKNLARGSIVSSEWTAQMVIAYKIMANFYNKKGLLAKAHAYELKADQYLSELGKMMISSPSPSGQGESCLPYATQDFVDTGHGWMTPKGKSTGSVAGTTYALFAYYDYNPLELKD